MPPQKVFVIAGQAASLLNFRGALLRQIKADGHELHVLAPELLMEKPTMDVLSTLSIIPHDIALSRTGMNAVADLRTFRALARLMRQEKPDVVICYTIKPVIWGILAAASVGVAKRVGLITGLGYAFTGEARGKRRLIQWIARGLYRKALARATLVFFQNPDDRQVFRDLKLLAASAPSLIVNGSGVETDVFAQAPLPGGAIRFLMIARLLGDKGVREYAAAAATIRAEFPDVQCDLVGGFDSNPDSIRETELEGWRQAGHVNWLGHLNDVKPAIAQCHVYVLPSYREGTPRTVLEAMAMGRAIITTDAPGCRETTVPNENGFLVPVADAKALAAAMRRFIIQPELIAQMGQASRLRAEEKYDVHEVNAVMLEAIGL